MSGCALAVGLVGEDGDVRIVAAYAHNLGVLRLISGDVWGSLEAGGGLNGCTRARNNGGGEGMLTRGRTLRQLFLMALRVAMMLTSEQLEELNDQRRERGGRESGGVPWQKEGLGRAPVARAVRVGRHGRYPRDFGGRSSGGRGCGPGASPWVGAHGPRAPVCGGRLSLTTSSPPPPSSSSLGLLSSALRILSLTLAASRKSHVVFDMMRELLPVLTCTLYISRWRELNALTASNQSVLKLLAGSIAPAS